MGDGKLTLGGGGDLDGAGCLAVPFGGRQGVSGAAVVLCTAAGGDGRTPGEGLGQTIICGMASASMLRHAAPHMVGACWRRMRPQRAPTWQR